MTENSFANRIPLWKNLPSTIKWITTNRDLANFDNYEERFLNLPHGINGVIILNSASMIEGFLEEILLINLIKCKNEGLLKRNKRFQKDFYRFIDEYLLKISKATFYNYNELFNTILGIKLTNIVNEIDSNLWRKLSTLFVFRNVIAHSESIVMEIDPTTNDFQYLGKFNDLQEYFRINHLIPDPIPEGTLFISMFLTDQIANHFFEFSMDFIRKFNEYLSSKKSYKNITAIENFFRFD